MKCENCGQNEANIHMVRIENGVAREVYLCNNCAGQYGMLSGTFSLKDLLTSFMPAQAAETPRACSKCGTTMADIKRTGFAGCENCYNDLREELLPMIKAIQGSVAHVGSAPAGAEPRKSAVNEMDALKGKLKAAIEQERYEEAAQLRDRIRVMQQAKGGI